MRLGAAVARGVLTTLDRCSEAQARRAGDVRAGGAGRLGRRRQRRDAVARGHSAPQPRDFYEWSEAGLKGHALYRQSGCNNCHRAMGVGEIGHRARCSMAKARAAHASGCGVISRTRCRWCRAARTTATSGPTFARSATTHRHLLAEFLFGLKAGAGITKLPHSRPPITAERSLTQKERRMGGDTLIPYIWAATGLVMLVVIVLLSTGRMRTASSTRTSRTRSSAMATTTATERARREAARR